MNKQNSNHHDNVILPPHLSGVATRKARRNYWIANFNNSSPQHRAMKAHLRASAYNKGRASEPVLSLAGSRSVPGNDILPWLHLRRRYDEQASRNFVRDSLMLAVMVAISAWALIHAVQTIAGP